MIFSEAKVTRTAISRPAANRHLKYLDIKGNVNVVNTSGRKTSASVDGRLQNKKSTNRKERQCSLIPEGQLHRNQAISGIHWL
ncbi:hypothetical protein MSWHS_1494 [Methanosarcina sp. WWM596]|nr:hypothetical protein MSWHS_1494 [Methanosarcina sp. WWM596]AKB22101.1 hypothetical protein MSWH1_1830 [Methanosarcina sp. WH1]